MFVENATTRLLGSKLLSPWTRTLAKAVTLQDPHRSCAGWTCPASPLESPHDRTGDRGPAPRRRGGGAGGTAAATGDPSAPCEGAAARGGHRAGLSDGPLGADHPGDGGDRG